MTMKKYLAFGILAAAAAFAAPVSASTVIDGSCVSVGASDGCLFDGNINSSGSGNNSYLVAQNAYNLYNNTHPSANPDIFLNVIASTNDANFASFGSFTGGVGTSGTWTLSGYLVNFVAVKASNEFVLYELATPSSTGNWNTSDIPFGNNPHGLSHLVFFGSRQVSAVPEPSTWGMMLLGFGAIGAAMRRRRRPALLRQAA